MKPMNETQFINEIESLFDYFVRRLPKETAVLSWYQKIKTIPHRDLKLSIEYVKDNNDNIPQNIPKAIKTAFFTINRSKNSDMEIKPLEHCEYCNSSGAFKLLLKNQWGNRYEPIVFCAHCKNWLLWTNDHTLRRTTVYKLQERNIIFKPSNKPFTFSETSVKGNKVSVKRLEKLALERTKKIDG